MQREALAPEHEIIVTTTDTIVGHEIKAYKGIVSGRSFLGELNVIPKTPEGIKDERAAVELAENNLKLEADAVGANAVVGVSVETIKLKLGIIISMSGTAVVIDQT